jgi:hypothetical protein
MSRARGDHVWRPLDEDDVFRGLRGRVRHQSQARSADGTHLGVPSTEWVIAEHAAKTTVPVTDGDRDPHAVEADSELLHRSESPRSLEHQPSDQAPVVVERLGTHPNVRFIPSKFRTAVGLCGRPPGLRTLDGRPVAWSPVFSRSRLSETVRDQQFHG